MAKLSFSAIVDTCYGAYDMVKCQEKVKSIALNYQ